MDDRADELPPTETNTGTAQPALYAAINLRARAFLFDTALVCGGIIVLLILSAFLDEVPGFGRFFVIAMFALIVLYEPIFVSARGATIGHRWANIQIVRDATGRAPSFPIAFVRFLVKAFLGFPSFLAMAFTRRRQSIHDVVSGTTVRLRDPSLARSWDVIAERPRTSLVEHAPPSRLRRLVISLLYLCAAYGLLGGVQMALVSHACLATDACSAVDETNSSFVGFLNIAATVAIVVLGWRGMLPGARRSPRVSTPTA